MAISEGDWAVVLHRMGVWEWGAASALVFALAAWTVLLRPAFRALFPPDRTEASTSSGSASTALQTFLILMFLRPVRYPRRLGMLVSLLLVAGALLSSSPWVWLVAALAVALAAQPPSKKPVSARIGLLLIWITIALLIAGSFSDAWERSAAALLDVRPGLNFSRFKNTNFAPPAVERGSVWSLNLSKGPGGLLQGDYFSIVFESELYIERTGEYIFHLTSDDGSTLYLDDRRAVFNPGYHAAREVSETIHLQAGWHALKLEYFNGTADAMLRLEWTPPGSGRQVVPATCLYRRRPTPSRLRLYQWITAFLSGWMHLILILVAAWLLRRAYPITRRKNTSGLQAESRRRRFRLPAFPLSPPDLKSWIRGAALGAVIAILYLIAYYAISFAPAPHGLTGEMYETERMERIVSTFDGRNARFHSLTHHELRRSVFGAVFDGYLHVNKAGDARFTMRADNGARIYFDDRLVADAWNNNPRKPVEAKWFLSEGLHHLHIEMFNRNLPAFIDIKWQPAGAFLMRPLPLWDLYPRRIEDEVLSRDRRYRAAVRAAEIALLLLTAAGVLLPMVRRREPWRPASIYPPALSVFLMVFLWQLPWMRPEHRYGFNWFLDAPLLWKCLVSAAVLVLGWPAVRRRITGLPAFCAGRRALKGTLFIFSLAAAATGQLIFSHVIKAPAAWGAALYVAAGAAVILIRDMQPPLPPADRTDPPETSPLKWFLFTSITLAAVFVRFYRLHEMPPGLWWDEAQTGWVARDILAGHFPPIYDLRINAGTAASYLVAGWFKLFGHSVYAMRTYTAFIGVLTVWASFAFFKRFVSTWWSFFGMALIALSRWLFSINRVTMATIDETILVAFLVFIFYPDAVRKRRLSHAVITGVLLGLGLHLHTGARVLPLIVGADMVVRFLQEGRTYLKKHGRNAAVIIVSAVIVFAPMGKYILDHRDAYFKRSKQTLLATEYPGWYPVPIILDNIVNYLKMYPYSGDWHPRHNTGRTPQLPPVVAVLALFGCALALARLREHDPRLFVLGFALVSLQGILTVHNGTANLNRVAENIPIVHLWAVTGAVFIIHGLGIVSRRRKWRIFLAALPVLAVLVSGARAMRIYFHQHLRDHAIVGDYGFQPELTECAEYVRKLIRENPRLHVWAQYTRSDSFRYVFPGHPRLHDMTGGQFPKTPRKYPMALVVQRNAADLERHIRERFPEASVVEVPYSLDSEYTLFRVFFIPSVTDSEIHSGATVDGAAGGTPFQMHLKRHTSVSKER